MNNGYTKVSNWIIEARHFSIYEKMVLIVILKHQMNKSESWPTQQRISVQASCSLSQVKRAIKSLILSKVLFIKKNEFGRNNIYVIVL